MNFTQPFIIFNQDLLVGIVFVIQTTLQMNGRIQVLQKKRIHELATYQYPASAMKAHPISKDFLKNEDPTEPFTYEILEELVYEDE